MKKKAQDHSNLKSILKNRQQMQRFKMGLKLLPSGPHQARRTVVPIIKATGDKSSSMFGGTMSASGHVGLLL